MGTKLLAGAPGRLESPLASQDEDVCSGVRCRGPSEAGFAENEVSRRFLGQEITGNWIYET